MQNHCYFLLRKSSRPEETRKHCYFLLQKYSALLAEMEKQSCRFRFLLRKNSVSLEEMEKHRCYFLLIQKNSSLEETARKPLPLPTLERRKWQTTPAITTATTNTIVSSESTWPYRKWAIFRPEPCFSRTWPCRPHPQFFLLEVAIYVYMYIIIYIWYLVYIIMSWPSPNPFYSFLAQCLLPACFLIGPVPFQFFNATNK